MPAPAFFVLMSTVALLLAATGASAAAAPAPSAEAPSSLRGLVIVLRPQEVDEMTRIALARINGELSAARFRVRVMPLDPARDPAPQVESVAIDAHPVAVFAITRITDHEGDTIAIWVCDRLARRTTIQRMAISGEDIQQDAEVLALEAIEMIRVNTVGAWPTRSAANTVSSAAPSPVPPTAAVSTPPPPPSGKPSSSGPEVDAPAVTNSAPVLRWPAGAWPEFSVGLGVAGLRDTGGQSMAWMGALNAVAHWPRGFAVRAMWAGLGSSSTIAGTGGTADVHHLLAALGAAWFWSPLATVDVFVAGALGAARVEVSGTTTDLARAVRHDSSWVPTGSAGPGAQIRLSQHLALGAAAELVWAWPHLDVAVGDLRTAALLRPAVLFTVGLQASF